MRERKGEGERERLKRIKRWEGGAGLRLIESGKDAENRKVTKEEAKGSSRYFFYYHYFYKVIIIIIIIIIILIIIIIMSNNINNNNNTHNDHCNNDKTIHTKHKNTLYIHFILHAILYFLCLSNNFHSVFLSC